MSVSLLSIAAAACGGESRSRLAVKEIVQSSGSSTDRWAFIYREGGQIDRVDHLDESALRTTIEYEYDSDQIVSALVRDLSAGDGNPREATYHYTDGALDEVSFRISDDRTDRMDIEYQGGAIARSVYSRFVPDATERIEVDYFYDEEGRLIRVASVARVIEEVRQATELEVRYTDGNAISRITRSEKDRDPVLHDFVYDDENRIDEVTTIDGRSWQVTYDRDGRMQRIERESGNSTYRIEYEEDLSVEGAVFSPPFEFGSFFDLEGRPFVEPEPKDVATFLGTIRL